MEQKMEKVNHKLKPCPFCGSIEDVEFTPASISGHFATPPSIGCLKCAYTFYGATTFYGNDEEQMMKFSDNLLINWWNRRSYEKSNLKRAK